MQYKVGRGEQGGFAYSRTLSIVQDPSLCQPGCRQQLN
jgi:hypothetical protein